MVLIRNFVNIFFIPELRKKLFFTLAVLFIYRIGHHIPVIGINLIKLSDVVKQSTGLGGWFATFDLFSGGGLSQGMLFALGISPYITASIMMQMLTLSVPWLEEKQKEGEYGRKAINQLTRYLALGVAIIQSFGIALIIERYELALEPGWSFRLMFMLAITVGSMFVMWLGEQISLFGLGNGSSMIIFAGIVANFPSDIRRIFGAVVDGVLAWPIAMILFAVFLIIAACIIFLEKGERKVSVQYTRRIVGQRVYGGQSSYIPFKLNIAGVMPVIFANALLGMLSFPFAFLAAYAQGFKWLADQLTSGSLLYNVLSFLLIIAFSFLYTTLIFNPEELADNIKKSGAFVPGIRPGRKTAEFFNYILTRLGFVGALYLGCLALLPAIVYSILNTPSYLRSMISGTSLLIVVGVALETAAQIESYLIEHRYEGFLSSGRLKGRV